MTEGKSGTDEDGSMNSTTTTQRYGTAAVAVARALDVYVAGNELMIQGSWSIPCTRGIPISRPAMIATFQKTGVSAGTLKCS